MSLKNIFEILDQIVEHSVELEMYETAEYYSLSGWGLPKRAADDFISSMSSSSDEISHLRPRLVNAILELSTDEAQKLLEKIKETQYELILTQTMSYGLMPIKFKLRMAKLFWPEYDMAMKIVNVTLREIQNRQPDFGLDNDDRKDFIKTKEKGIAVLTPLKELVQLKIADDELVSLILDSLMFKSQDDIEEISSQLANLVACINDVSSLELISRIWSNLSPETVDRKLSYLIASNNPKEKENALRILMFMGKNPMTIVEGNHIAGDSISLSGDFRGANIPIKSKLEDVTITITNSSIFDAPTKDALITLIQQLNELLRKAPKELEEDAKAVADTAEILVKTATDEKPNKSTIKITADSLKKAAENIAKVLPSVIPIVKQIISLLMP